MLLLRTLRRVLYFIGKYAVRVERHFIVAAFVVMLTMVFFSVYMAFDSYRTPPRCSGRRQR